ncbi:superoxide dismutase [Methanimicrococcus blatticola]|uniref:Superoxide dismutase n=1 Tax=Methanimicrococcus blatticola TaxID=91560 RepID=A0A484F2S5_9EURY|nr:superoxide dismutase [Methanimicrococcus blatticola]MBZ3935407.1 superoxide dismutase [Methanimicrococcus blatticola]MCC2508495.1 superoxide dismutase [Methanimicrococcus blatticola]TDQ67804.1 Fe-Mn family superoxide dismutase [Methanimicrococcus blatticola]
MAVEYIKLPYEQDALEPVITRSTIGFHYGKHLKTYVDKTNELIKGTEFENLSLEDIVKKAEGPLFNNAGQVLNHNLYFMQFVSQGSGKPIGKLAKAIDDTFGSFENFTKEFEAAGIGLFGSGWVFLAKDKNGKLSIVKGQNAENPITKGMETVLVIDVWEHAYYLDYQNRRADYLKLVWNIIDWNEAERRFE